MKKKKSARKKFKLNKLWVTVAASLFLALASLALAIIALKVATYHGNDYSTYQISNHISNAIGAVAGHEMAQAPAEQKQYLPEARIRFDYAGPRDILTYSYDKEAAEFTITSKEIVAFVKTSLYRPSLDEVLNRVPAYQTCSRPFIVKLANHNTGPLYHDDIYTQVEKKSLDESTIMSVWEYTGEDTCPHIHDELRDSIIATLLSAEQY